MYNPDRKIILYGILGLCVFFLILDIGNVLMGETTVAYLLGFPFGVLFGVTTYLLRPRNTNYSSMNIRWQWSVPLGVLVANILLNFADSLIADLIIGVVGGWLYTTLGCIVFQVWRHSKGD